MHRHITPTFFGVKDEEKFVRSLETMIQSLSTPGYHASDNLITWSKTMGFFSDPTFMNAARKHAISTVEQGVLWRTHTLCWAASQGMRLKGDLVECGTYRGTSAAIIADYVSLQDSGKLMWLYDLFEHKGESTHHSMPEHSEQLFNKVQARFSHLPCVHVIKGSVPESFSQGIPDQISFLHIDMNNVAAEIGALDTLWERVTTGAAIVLDDYGWIYYQAQKNAEDAWLKRYGVSVLEMPTGQGLVIKP